MEHITLINPHVGL